VSVPFNLCQELRRRHDQNPSILLKLKKMAVPRHNDLGASRNGAGQNHVIVRINCNHGLDGRRLNPGGERRITGNERVQINPSYGETLSEFGSLENFLNLGQKRRGQVKLYSSGASRIEDSPRISMPEQSRNDGISISDHSHGGFACARVPREFPLRPPLRSEDGLR